MYKKILRDRQISESKQKVLEIAFSKITLMKKSPELILTFKIIYYFFIINYHV